MRISVPILAFIAVTSIGCAAPLASGVLSGSRQQDDVVHVGDGEDDGDNPRAAAIQKATADQPISQEQALADILHQLQEIRAIDPEAERQLMADLQDAKPEHYPLIVDAFRAALAYREQLAERERLAADVPPLIATDASFAEAASHESPAPERDSAERAAAVQASLAAARATKREPYAEPPAASDRFDTSRQDSTHYAVPPASTIPPPAAAASPALAAESSPAPTPGAYDSSGSAVGPLGNEGATVRPAAYEEQQTTRVDPIEDAAQVDWQAELLQSIAELERTVAARPTSVAELHDHLRLRTLQLLAGRQEQAFLPIPGASADQQDYWSKQLFAIAAYLDTAGNLDDKQRAAAALSALDEARAKLSELATLQIRSATFVTSVDGFGAYQPVESTKFQPGEKVMLYAEVENFRSSAAEDGYHTSLATSYQVLDKTGQRVDGKQFPDVVDKCRNRRRDFHMQYEFPLPTQIYPGEYDLELTITDHNSGKIGQMTLPFEIAGER